MSHLEKVGLPSHQAAGARRAKRLQQILDQRDAALSRIEANFNASIRALIAETDQSEVEPSSPDSDPETPAAVEVGAS